MTHEQKMKNQFPDYPCATCIKKEKDSCPFRDCERYKVWFSRQWSKFQNGARQIKMRQEQYTDDNVKKDVYFHKSDSTELSDVEKITRIIM